MAAFTEQQKTEFSMQKWYDLSGKTAVVTGGITGLGLAIARNAVIMHRGSIKMSGQCRCESDRIEPDR